MASRTCRSTAKKSSSTFTVGSSAGRNLCWDALTTLDPAYSTCCTLHLRFLMPWLPSSQLTSLVGSSWLLPVELSTVRVLMDDVSIWRPSAPEKVNDTG